VTISLVGTPTTAEASGTTGLTNNVPTGVADNDFLVWLEGQTTSTVIGTPPTGFTLLQSLGNVAVSMHLWYRIASSEPASYTTPARTASRAAGTMLAFRGVDLTNPWDVTTPTFVTGTTAIACPACTPVTAGAWLLGFAAANVASGVINTTLSSSNLTAIDGQVTSTAAASTNNVCGCGHFLWTSGAFTPAFTASNATVRTLGGSAALRPAAGGAVVAPFRAEPVVNRAALIRASNF
jgi:hypothetical protein